MDEIEREKLKRQYLKQLKEVVEIDFPILVEEIIKDFADVEYPQLEYFAGSEKLNSNSNEFSRVNEFFVGKTWQECIELDAYRRLCGGQSFFEPIAWHYFLPAYLILKMKHESFSNDYEFEETTEDADLIEFQTERIRLLTSDQCKVIITYLELVLKVWKGIAEGFEDSLEPLEFWKKNYQDALEGEKINK